MPKNELDKISNSITPIKDHLADLQKITERMGFYRARVYCADGLNVSIQANEFTYCEPRKNHGPYISAELGMPNRTVPEWLNWAEEPNKPTDTIYARVPIEQCLRVIQAHGGRVLPPKGQPIEPRSIGIPPEVLSQTAKRPNLEDIPPIQLVASLTEPELLIEHCVQWAQACVLGTPMEERSKRFEIREANELIMSWDSISDIFCAVQPEAEPSYWVCCAKKIQERQILELNTKKSNPIWKKRNPTL